MKRDPRSANAGADRRRRRLPASRGETARRGDDIPHPYLRGQMLVDFLDDVQVLNDELQGNDVTGGMDAWKSAGYEVEV